MALNWYVLAPPTTGLGTMYLKKTRVNMTGLQPVLGPMTPSLKLISCSMAGKHPYVGPISASCKKATANFVGRQEIPGTMGASLRKTRADITQVSIVAQIGSSTKKLSSNIAGQQPVSGSISASVKKTLISLNGKQTYTGALAAALQKASTYITGSQKQSGTASLAIKKATAKLLTRPEVVTTYGTSGEFSATVNPTTGTIPSWGAQVNDLVIVVYNVTQKVLTITPPAGWFSLLGGSDFSSCVDNQPALSTPDNCIVLGHFITSAEITADTRAWTLTGLFSVSSAARRYVAVVRGADSTNPIDVAAKNSSSTADKNLVIPGLSPTKDKELVLCFGGINAVSTNITISTPTVDYTSVGGIYGTGGTTRTVFIAKGTADTVAGSAYAGKTLTMGTNTDWACVSVAIAPISQ